MFGKPSLFTRIAVGKLIGFLVGLSGFLLLPLFLPDAGWLLLISSAMALITLSVTVGVMVFLIRQSGRMKTIADNPVILAEVRQEMEG